MLLDTPVSTSTDSTETTVGTEIDKLVERLGILPALDLTRLRLVVYEMVLHRQWISPNIRLFAGGTWAGYDGILLGLELGWSWGYVKPRPLV